MRVIARLAFLAPPALLILAGCTYTSIEYGDARMTSWRLWTDTSVSLETPDVRASYSSDADTAAAATLNQRLLDEVLSVGRFAAP